MEGVKLLNRERRKLIACDSLARAVLVTGVQADELGVCVFSLASSSLQQGAVQQSARTMGRNATKASPAGAIKALALVSVHATPEAAPAAAATAAAPAATGSVAVALRPKQETLC